MDFSSIGVNIKRYRLEAKMSQSKLAEQSGISTKYVSALERSEKPPSLETLVNIANALNITADMLLCDVLNKQVNIKQAMIGDIIKGLPQKEQLKIIAIVELLADQAKS